MANWLNVNFQGFDYAIITAISSLRCGFLTFISNALTLFFEKGLIIFVVCIFLCLFRKTRKSAVCIGLAVFIGGVLTNGIVKNLVERTRPFLDENYNALWVAVGSPNESGYSFPSGHVTAITSAATAMFLSCNKKWSFVGFILVPIMAFARIYLVAHYPTDCIAGILVGGIAGVVTTALVYYLYKVIEEKNKVKFFKWCITFDIRDYFKKGEENK